MSRRERERLAVLAGVRRKELTLRQASTLLVVGYRQTKRLWRRYLEEGDAGLVHRLRGKPGARRKPDAVRAAVLALYEQKDYSDFGPTLLAEHLARRNMEVDHETVRRWLLAEGQWTLRRRRQKHRQWRERKPSFGEMVQLDGSHHDWFEGRRAPCVLMVMVDDATNRVWAQFFEEETTHASYDTFENWVRKHGLPQSLYVDRDSIYRSEGKATIAQQLTGKEPQTQLGRAMEQLGVDLILAHSPQAKGRVERMNGVLQDRLVKELRLAGISDLESANRFLRQYLRGFNRQFGRQAASTHDAHRPVPRHLDQVLSWEEQRVVQADWTVACGGQWYQLDRQHEPLSLVRRKVIVRTLRDGRQQIEYRGQKLKWRLLPARPQPRVRKPAVLKERTRPPAMEHPWRRFGMGVGRAYGRRVRRRGKLAGAPIRAGGGESVTRGDRRQRELEFGRPSPPLAPPARIDGATTVNSNQPRGHSLLS